MEALPDPEAKYFASGKHWLQSNVPGRLLVEDINLMFHENGNNTWTVTYAERDPSMTLLDFRRYISSQMGKHCKVTRIAGIYKGKQMKWQVSVVPRTSRRQTLWQFIPCLTFTNKNVGVETHDNKGVKKACVDSKEKKTSNKFDLTKTTPNDCMILGSDNQMHVIKDFDSDKTLLPKKLFHQGKDVTKKVFQKSRLCNHFLSIMQKSSNKPLIRSKTDVKIQFVKQSDADHPSSSVKSPVLSHVTQPRREVAIPLCYDNIERNYKLSKLRDRQVFRSALEFVAIFNYQRKLETGELSALCNFPIHTPLDLKHHLVSNGLPVDESLTELFHSYCTEAGIGEDEISAEERHIIVRYKK